MTEFYLESQKTYNGRYMYLSCTQQQDLENNKSIISWTLTVTGGTSNYYTTGPTTITIDGQQVYYAPTVYYNAPAFPASKGSVSGTVEVSHSIDGSKTIQCEIKTAIYDGVLRTTKGTWELDTIPRASTIGATDSYIGSVCAVLIDRKSSQYTHEIAFCNPDLDGFLGEDGSLHQDPVRLEATSISFRVPAYLYDRIPNAKGLECTLICTTYLGDVQIGQDQSCTFYASCREEDCIPEIKVTVTDQNPETLRLTWDENRLVRFFSQARCQIEATPKHGATIVQKQVDGVAIPDDVVILEGVEKGQFLFRVTDSRGFTGEVTVEKILVPYVKLTANGTLKRQSPTSDRVELTLWGDWWPNDFGEYVNTLDITCQVLGQTVPLTLSYRERGYTATATIEGLAYDRSHVVTVTVADQLMEHHLSLVAKPGVPVFDWGQKDFVFHVPVTLADGSGAISENALRQLLTQWGLLDQ